MENSPATSAEMQTSLDARVRTIAVRVPAAFDGATVTDVARRFAGVSHKALSHAKFTENGVRLDGVRVRCNARVREGQLVEIVVGDSEQTAAHSAQGIEPQRGHLDIVYEDADLVVVNKPAGMVMYPNRGHRADTLGNYLLGHFAVQGRTCALHPVHRLDKGTSGLVVFATNPHAQHKLQQALHTGAFRRTYWALCEGTLDEERGTVDAPIGLLSRQPNVYGLLAESAGGKRAVTHYRVLRSGISRIAGEAKDGAALVDATYGGAAQDGIGQNVATPTPLAAVEAAQPSATSSPCTFSLVELELETGRTHQIRIHLASIGHPLLGDVAYGRPSPLIARPALHSRVIELSHPITGEPLRLEAPLPTDLSSLLQESHAVFDVFQSISVSPAKSTE